MANKRFEMYEYRNILVRMRQGDSDRALAKAGVIGRPKALRAMAQAFLDQLLDVQLAARKERPFLAVERLHRAD